MVSTPLTAWTLMRGQLAYLQSKGFEVTLVSNPDALLEKTAQREGVACRGIPMERTPDPRGDAMALYRLVRLLREVRPHIVHTSTPKAGLLGSLAARVAGVPCRVFTLRGLRAEGLDGVGAVALRALERVTCACAQRIVCVSHSLRAKAAEMRLASPSKLIVIGAGSSNGVDAARFESTPELLERSRALRYRLGLQENRMTIGFVGRRVRDKGVVELLLAVKRVRQRWPEVQLLVVGPREAADDQQINLLETALGDVGVYYTGFLEDPAPAYQLMNMMILPSYREGFPNVSLEAAAAARPAIVSDATGCVDAVIDGRTGFIVPMRDERALANAIERYLAEPELAIRHGLAGRKRVLVDFQPEQQWSGLEAVYQELLTNAGYTQ